MLPHVTFPFSLSLPFPPSTLPILFFFSCPFLLHQCVFFFSQSDENIERVSKVETKAEVPQDIGVSVTMSKDSLDDGTGK